jgi:guanylate kinase
MEKRRKIILVGKAASGKDWFKDFLVKEGYAPSISHTTRPSRMGEYNGVTYNFVSDLKFRLMIFFGMFLEYKKFNGWFYGNTKKQARNAEVFILTPSGLRDFPKEIKQNSTIIYFSINTEIRRRRLMKRSDYDNLERRMMADRKDFRNFKEYDLKITYSKFNCHDLLSRIEG